MATTRKLRPATASRAPTCTPPLVSGSTGRRSHSKRASSTASTSGHIARGLTAARPARSDRTSATAVRPAIEPRHDAGVAADRIPAGGASGPPFGQEALEGHGNEGEELHDRRADQAPAAEEQEQRARGAAAAQRQRRMEPVGDAETR